MKKSTKLSEFYATAICGNDISSSVLYVSALSIFYAGKYAWVTLLVVAVVLYFFRKIYGEVVGALPLNGGAYNALLNTSSKSVASYAATLTILSYMATSVISANEAIHYLHSIIPGINIINFTIGLLGIFAVLAILGIKESAKVAAGIFVFHLSSLVLLIGFLFFYLISNGWEILITNYNAPLSGSLTNALFFGFAASMLGISGFESSANYVEEQKPGVFPKTLRNMWVIVSIVNPLMAFLALTVLPIPEIRHSYGNTLLSEMGFIAGGSWLSWLISADAFLVLSGAVLTSYVGVTGLLERMTLDRIMPPFFLKKNKRKSSYRIIILFFLLSVSVLLITEGRVKALAGVYTISFLSVMALFAIGNILLKVKRKKLPRPVIAGKISVGLALIAVVLALVGNILIEPNDAESPSNFTVFLDYFIPAILFIIVMLNRIALLRLVLMILNRAFEPIRAGFLKLHKVINSTIHKINDQEFVFFTRGDNLSNLNRVMLYIEKNEHTRKIKIATVLAKGQNRKFLPALQRDIEFLDREYPEIDIEFVVVEGNFTPALVQKLSREWKIPVNFMFIGSPGDHFPYRIEELGGVRLII